jgi:guanine deaminase
MPVTAGVAFKLKPMNKEANKFMRKAIRISVANVEKQKGGPFGAIVVKGGKIIARGYNQVTATNDPTAHAEVVAIRKACKALKTFQLTGCEIYTSCEPCPMCLGAIYWARPDKLYYANSKEDAAAIQFDDQFIYEEIAKPVAERKLFTQQILREKAQEAFEKWKTSPNKIEY